MPSVSNITPPSSMGVTDATKPGAAGTKAKNEIDRDMFLKLLVTQLKYQDPLNPASPDQFLAQTAQFTTVEKLTQMADDGAKSALGQRMTTASALIGKAVTYAGDGGLDATGTVQSARITDTGDIMLNLGGTKELGLLEVKVIAPPAAPAVTAGSASGGAPTS
jgi:flagellar basal-body rod modification protein FlgD